MTEFYDADHGVSELDRARCSVFTRLYKACYIVTADSLYTRCITYVCRF